MPRGLASVASTPIRWGDMTIPTESAAQPTTPLRDRVPAATPVVPADTAELRWRSATFDDLDRLMEIYTAIAAADHPNYGPDRDEEAEELRHSYVNLPLDSLVAEDVSTGSFAAVGLNIMPPVQETLVRSILQGGVHPSYRGRGIGRALLQWQTGRGLQQLATSDKPLPGWLMVGTDKRATASTALYARAGFTPTRWFLGQERDVSTPIPEIAIDGPVRIVPYEPRYSEATRVAKNASFRDHWGSQPTEVEQWNSMVGLPTFSAAHSYLAVTADDEVVGLLITFVNEEDWARQGFTGGYIGLVGVVREWRKRGIAPALLARVMHSYADAGWHKASLDVDSDNPTGALGLYTGMGFTETTREVSFTQVF